MIVGLMRPGYQVQVLVPLPPKGLKLVDAIATSLRLQSVCRELKVRHCSRYCGHLDNASYVSTSVAAGSDIQVMT